MLYPGYLLSPTAPGKPVEAEVESLEELREALKAGADIVMLDELSLEDMREVVSLNAGRAKLEASDSINDSTLRVIAETGVGYISLGTLTKDMKAVDFTPAVGAANAANQYRAAASSPSFTPGGGLLPVKPRANFLVRASKNAPETGVEKLTSTRPRTMLPDQG